jgi:hypothetical protein
LISLTPLCAKGENAVAEGKRLVFTKSCAYPDGIKVFCFAMADVKGVKFR